MPQVTLFDNVDPEVRRDKPLMPVLQADAPKIKYFQDEYGILMVTGYEFSDMSHLKEINKMGLPADFNSWRTVQSYYVTGRMHQLYVIEKENPE